MKLNITVELDWMDEEGNLDDDVLQQLSSGIQQRISDTVTRNLEKEAKKAFENSVANADEAIKQRALQFVEDWLNKEVEITDKWGDVKESCSINDLIKRRFDDLLLKKVNDKGEFSDNYNANHRLIDWLTSKKIELQVNDALKHYNRDIDKNIKEQIDSGIRERVSDQFAKMVVGAAEHNHREQQKLIKADS